MFFSNACFLLVLASNCFVLGDYFGEVHDDLRGLCVLTLLPAGDDSGELGTFKTWWNVFLNRVGDKLFPNDQQNDYQARSEEHCSVLKPENDPICAYRDFVNIGKEIEQDIGTFEQKMASSVKAPTFYYRAYCLSWLEHPKFYRLECGNDMDILWDFMAELSISVVKGDKHLLTQMKNVFDSSHAAGLRGEIEKTDCSKVSSKHFCQLKCFTESADKIERLLLISGSSKNIYKTAIQLHFYGVKLQAPRKFRPKFLSTTEQEVKTWIKLIIADVVDSLENGSSKFEHLINVGDLLPPSHYLPCNTLAEFPSLEKSLCTFTGVMYPLKPYIQSLIASNRRLVSTTINYKEYMEQKRFEQILDMVETTHYTLTHVAQQLKHEMRKGTGELKRYFQATAVFDMKIANADVESISRDLIKYEEKSTVVSKELDAILSGIIAGAWTAVSGDLAETGTLLGLAIASAAIPTNLIFGGNVVGDIVTATQDLLQALAKVTELEALTSSLGRLIDESQNFINKIKLNEKALKPVKILIAELNKDKKTKEFNEAKDKFITLYGNYDPVVGPDELAGLSAFWTAVIADGCRILEATFGAVSGGVKAVVGGLWLCPKAEIAVNKLIAVFEELVEYQSSMMVSLVNYVRATATYNAAKVINQDYALKSPEGIDLELLAGFSMACYKVAIFSAMESYCNILEYREGERPDQCKGGRTITSLLGRSIPAEKTCNIMQLLVTIPTKPQNVTDSAFIDLESVYAGKTITFQIPDSDWLVEHGWISARLKRSKFFIRRFEIYLPTVSKWKTIVTVTAEAITGNKHHPPGSTEYILKPTIALPVYTYKEGEHGRTCSQSKITNYYTDDCRDLPDICPITSEKYATPFPNDVYPSIYARWNIRVNGYEGAKLTVPASELLLRAKLEVCMLYNIALQRSLREPFYNSSSLSRISYPISRRTSASSVKFCGTGQYFQESSRKCTTCPPGSESIDKYNGLLCGNITQLVIGNSTKVFLTFQEAKNECRQLGTTITSPADMDRAVNLGYDECACGWLSDGSVRAPKPKANCTENIGTNSIECTGRNKWVVYCGTNF